MKHKNLWLLAAIILFAAFVVHSINKRVNEDDAFRQSCAAQGYYAIITRDARACVDERVIRYEETR